MFQLVPVEELFCYVTSFMLTISLPRGLGWLKSAPLHYGRPMILAFLASLIGQSVLSSGYLGYIYIYLAEIGTSVFRKPTYDAMPLFHTNGLCGHQRHDDLKTCEFDTIIRFIAILTGISVAGVFGWKCELMRILS